MSIITVQRQSTPNTESYLYIKQIVNYRCLHMGDILKNLLLRAFINVIKPKTMFFCLFVCALVHAQPKNGLTVFNAIFSTTF